MQKRRLPQSSSLPRTFLVALPVFDGVGLRVGVVSTAAAAATGLDGALLFSCNRSDVLRVATILALFYMLLVKCANQSFEWFAVEGLGKVRHSVH